MGVELFKFRVSCLDGFTNPMESNDFWCSGECAKHEDDAFVFFQVRDRLDAATGQIQISHRLLVKHAKRPAIFRRAVHVAFLREGRRCHKKHLLRRKPFSQFPVDRLVSLSHKNWLQVGYADGDTTTMQVKVAYASRV